MANPRDLMVVRARVGGHDVVEDLSALSALSAAPSEQRDIFGSAAESSPRGAIR